MNILITGDFDPKYNRTAIIIKGLRQRKDVNTKIYRYCRKNPAPATLKANAKEADIIFLPSFTHQDVRFVKKHTHIPLIFDPLISKYLTKVYDYKQIWKYSPRALKNYLKDKLSMTAADAVVADTIAHKNYFSEKFKIPPQKIHTLYIGADTELFYPLNKTNSNNYFEVGFYGGFIPLQGLEKIMKAAFILKKYQYIKFKIIGDGFESKKILTLANKLDLKNVEFTGWVKHEKLAYYIANFDLCLGIFGTTPKTDLVIPNKIYHYAAMQKPILTKNTKAIKELFTDNENIKLSSNTPEAIAENILKLAEDKQLRIKIAESAHLLIKENHSHTQVADKLVDIIATLRS